MSPAFAFGVFAISHFLRIVDATLPPNGNASAEYHTTPLDNQLNKIMIPVAFLLLFLVSVVCWILYRLRKKQQDEDERRRFATFHNSTKHNAHTARLSGFLVNTSDAVLSPKISPKNTTFALSDGVENHGNVLENNNSLRWQAKILTFPERLPRNRNVVGKCCDDSTDDEHNDVDIEHENDDINDVEHDDVNDVDIEHENNQYSHVDHTSDIEKDSPRMPCGSIGFQSNENMGFHQDNGERMERT